MYGRHRFGGIAHTTVTLALQPVSGLSRSCVCGSCPACATFPFAPPAHGCHGRESHFLKFRAIGGRLISILQHSRSPAGKALDAFLSWRRACLQATVQALSRCLPALSESEWRTPPSSRPSPMSGLRAGPGRTAASPMEFSDPQHQGRINSKQLPDAGKERSAGQPSALNWLLPSQLLLSSTSAATALHSPPQWGFSTSHNRYPISKRNTSTLRLDQREGGAAPMPPSPLAHWQPWLERLFERDCTSPPRKDDLRRIETLALTATSAFRSELARNNHRMIGGRHSSARADKLSAWQPTAQRCLAPSPCTSLIAGNHNRAVSRAGQQVRTLFAVGAQQHHQRNNRHQNAGQNGH